ncbi:hypothetical protein DPMN_116169 [Dreissena polymorpha]|uniref:Uncharacterized protein n=1 Tax=Dreissena polymorpha TaxID=45954 RepID=A0A9D4KN77_DREPO|nr:hypothetical protein DPMN_116169 [Dreissena polymorpha]
MASYPFVGCGQQVRLCQHAVECHWCNRWQNRKCDTEGKTWGKMERLAQKRESLMEAGPDGTTGEDEMMR